MRWFCTTNHKDVGTLQILLAVAAGLVGGALSLALRVQSLRHGSAILGAAVPWDAIVAEHGLVMIFFSVVPALLGGFGNWLIPLMIGAPGTAFPRLNAASLWIAFAGFLVAMVALFCWLPSPTPKQFSGAIDLMLVALMLACLATIFEAINFIATILNMRAPGMALQDMPLFVWSQLVTSFVLVLELPIFAAALTMLGVDRAFGTSWLDTHHAGDAAIFQHLARFFGQPGLLILILPAFGIVSEVVSTFSHRPIVGARVSAAAMTAIGLGGFVVWAQCVFAGGILVDRTAYAMGVAAVTAFPTSILLASWLVTLSRGSVALKTPMLWAAGFICMLVLGAASGLAANDEVSHFHALFALSAVFSMFAGFYFWIGKMSGRRYPEVLGQIHFWVTLGGAVLTFWPQEVWSAGLAPSGAYLLGASMVIFLAVAGLTFSRRPALQANYWGSGATGLEWTVPSPAPHETFSELAGVGS